MDVARIRIQHSNGKVEDRALSPGNYRVGRDVGEILLGDPNVSGRHALLDVRDEGILVTDVGSRNGTFDDAGNRVTTCHRLEVGGRIRMGGSSITLLECPRRDVTVAMAQAPAVAALPARDAALSPLPPHEGGGAQHHHPDQAVRHSYPVARAHAGLGEALVLLGETAPFVGLRLALLLGKTVATVLYCAMMLFIAAFFFRIAPLLGWTWIALSLGGALWFWGAVLRYVLYLLKAVHVVALTELITQGRAGNGSEGMLAHGRRVVTERFGQVNVLFAMDLLVDGAVAAFNRTLDWVGSLIPVPGLGSVIGVVQAVVRASTTYIDETVLSYSVARGDSNPYLSAKDGVIYYAQNAREILKTGVWVVVLEKLLAFAVLVLTLVPLGLLLSILSVPAWASIAFLIGGLLFARDVQEAVLRPLFLTMVLLKFHGVVRGQAIDPVWDERLTSLSQKFVELKARAAGVSSSRSDARVQAAA